MSIHLLHRARRHRARFVPALLGIVLLVTFSALGQTKPEQPRQDQADVVRVNTELVQTDVMVFDKKGHFVDGLKPEQFALRIDNKSQAISFFEQVASEGLRPVSSGRLRDERRAQTSGDAPATVIRGRTVIFFADDLHLAPDSLVRTRKALLEFIDRGMGEKDQVAITSSSGQIGFLQQLTDDKVALRSAVARLNYRANAKMDMDNPPMSEYIASKIRDGDESATSFYVSEMLKQNCYKAAVGMICMMSAQSARHLVRERAQMNWLCRPLPLPTIRLFCWRG